MRSMLVALCALMLAGCGQDNAKAVGEILGHRWSKAPSDCGRTYLHFSAERIDYVIDGKPAEPLPIKRIVSKMPEPSTVMFVIRVDKALAAKTSAPDDTSDIAFVYKVDGDRLKRTGEGTPDRIMRIRAGEENRGWNALRRCPG